MFVFLSNVSVDLFEIGKTCHLHVLSINFIIADAPFEKSVFLARVVCVAQM